MKKPFLYALVAVVYIIFIVSFINNVITLLPQKSLLIPICMLGLFVLSAVIMGFLFFYEPFTLYMDNKKEEAVIFFGKIVAIFACFVTLFIILLLFIK